MSYILEALKRAERERRAGSASLLDELPPAGNPDSPPGWQRWVLPAAISAFVAALATWLIVGHGSHNPPPAAPAPVAAAPPPQAAPAPPPAPPPPAAAQAADPEAAPAIVEDDGRIASLQDLDDRPPPRPQLNTADPPPEDAMAPPRVGHEDLRARVAAAIAAEKREQAAQAAPADSQADNGDDHTPPEPAPDAQAARRPSSVSPVPQAAAAQNLREMPDSFRASFPAVTVDVLAYADLPAQRFVLIEGKRYREGDTLPQGPQIFRIVPEGIVFDWQGQRVLYAMNH